MTELHAFRPVGTAFEKTRKILLEPFDLGTWIKLVIITFFVGSGSGAFNPGNTLQYAMNQSDVRNYPYYDFSHLLADTTLVILLLLLVIIILAFGLILSYLRGVFSFVFVEALTSGNVRIVQSFKDNMGRGFKAFLFNIVTSIISLAVIIGILAVIILALLWGIGKGGLDSLSTASILALIVVAITGVLAIIGFSLLMGLIIGFFYDFAVPLIYFKGMGLREAISHVIGLVRKQPMEFLVYIVVRWVMEIAVALVLGIILLFIFAIFFALGLLIAFAMFEAAKMSLLLAAPFALALLAGVLLLVIIMTVISLPISVYFRYYSLDFLRSLEPSYVNYAPRFV